MHFRLRLTLFGAILVAPVATFSQNTIAIADNKAAFADHSLSGLDETLPDAPLAQDATPSAPQNQQPASGSAPAQESSSTQQPPAQTDADKTQYEKAQEQVKEQEKQRVLGILPAFNTSYRGDAVSLTSKQKINLAFHSAIDPVTFGVALAVAGWGEAVNSDSDNGFGWGPGGYAKRAGAKYLDTFNGTMIGNGFLPSLLHQDPRYFRLGHGSTTHRTLYAISTAFVCKHDVTRRWEPNYSNVGGNLIAGAISNLYYPTSSGWSTTVENGMIVTAEGTVGAIFQEFWPDLSRKFLHKDPTHGLDAEARAADAAAKQAKKNQEK